MTWVRYHRPDGRVVIAGGGLSAQRAVETLRRNGYDGAIQLISDEPDAPYDRPPLSKDFLAGALGEEALRFRGDDWYADRGVQLRLGEPVAGLDADARQLLLASGERLPFSQLLIATGGAPRHLPGTAGFANVHHLRGLPDARRLRDAIASADHVAVIGAGLIGQEVASSARGVGAQVTVIEAAVAPLAGALGLGLGAWFAQLHREAGVELHLGARIARFHGDDAVEAIELDDRRRVECDTVVVGIGTVPATTWLAGSGLDTGGVAVDAAGRTAMPGIFAAGDASKRLDRRRGAYRRSEHWEAAARQGTDAARAMLGLAVAPPALPSFWSDQHGVRIQYLGDAHGATGLQIDGSPDDRDFTATFSRHDRPIAALLVGRPHALPAMRRRIGQANPAPPERTAA